jgi:hypothetical protein
MNRSPLLLAVLFLVRPESCAFTSFAPIADDHQLYADSSLVGTWASATSGGDSVSIVAAPNGTFHATSWSQAAPPQHSVIRLTRLGNFLYIDIQSADEAERNIDFVFLLHGIARVDRIRPSLVLRGLNGDRLATYLTAHPSAVRVIGYEDGYILADSTAQLRTFLRQFTADSGAFRSDSLVWTYVGSPRP